MNNRIIDRIQSVVFFTWIILSVSVLSLAAQGTDGWKAGVSRVSITPENPIWMGGYGFRDHPAEGTRQKLWAKALALEASNTERVVLVTSDLVGIPKSMADEILSRLNREYGLSSSQVILNCSHTHSGPVLSNSLVDIYPMDSLESEKADQYSQRYEDLIVKLVGKALRSMKPSMLYSGNGLTRFQVNRRANKEKELSPQTELKGPNDYAVPVLKVTDKKGKLMAIAFGYACHGTVLNTYQWDGDYPGYAQKYLEKRYPGAVALFFQGAAGDQNPLPRRSVALAKQYGGELSCAVQTVLDEEMQSLPASLKTASSEIELQLEAAPSEEDFRVMADTLSGWQQRWARRLLNETRNGELVLSYPYPLQMWNLGGQLLVAMGGEPTIAYAIGIKQKLGSGTFVLGYSNNVMGYIPSVKIIEEGGYEGESSQWAYGLPSKWKSDIEEKIYLEIEKLAKQVDAEITEDVK